MSRPGTWADHIIIQAVANSHNLIINVTETAPNFTETTIVSSIYANEHGGNARNIYIGHIDEIHYISTTAVSERQTTSINQVYANNISQFTPNSDKIVPDKPRNRKEYMKEYMKKKQKRNEFKVKENERKKRKNAKFKKSYKQSNPDRLIECSRKANIKYKQSNPEQFKESNRKCCATYKTLNAEKVKASSKKSNVTYRKNYPEKYKLSQKKQYLKRKLAKSKNENDLNQHKPKISINMSQAIEMFHKNISVGPEYICTCCQQLWYRSSVSKCNPDLYKSCAREIIDLCITGLKSIDDTEWICATCHSNLNCGKVPSCAKANKMSFPEKPDALKDLTPLEERLISPINGYANARIA
jgi:hypothetical protein